MSTLHICNTFFEWELENEVSLDLSEAFAQHTIFKQLQFLPFLYAKEEEGVLISEIPNPEYPSSLSFPTPTLHLLTDKKTPPCKKIESWGDSRIIAKWAKTHSLEYTIPSWDITKRLHSKQFSFENSTPLPEARLVTNSDEATKWLHQVKGKKILKTCLGTSGKGHLLIDESIDAEKVFSFLEKEWKKNLPVLAEPWVERLLDFSTQWLIKKGGNIFYLGATICRNTPRGQYESSEVGEEESLFGSYLPFLKDHQQIVFSVLQTMQNLGWFGHVGIDAFIYKQENVPTLHPIVEINARKTMGYVALMVQKHHFPKQKLRFVYSQNTAGFLPLYVISSKGKIHRFKRNLLLYPSDIKYQK